MIATAHLFRPLGRALLDLLQGLDAADWKQPATAEWSVSDVAAHLLDVDLRRLSIHRDAHQPVPPPAPIASAADLVQHLNSLNAVWIEAARRLSRQVVIDLLAVSTQQTADLIHITMGDLDLVRLLMHRLDDHKARGAATVEGDVSLAEPLFRARAVMVRTV